MGRVGALAVALGIGAAVGTWPTVAFAEPTDSSTSTPSDSTSQPKDETPSSSPNTPDPTPPTPKNDESQPSDPKPSTPDPRDGIVQARGGAEVRVPSDTGGTEITSPPVDKTDSEATTAPRPKSEKPKNDPPPSSTVTTPPKHVVEPAAPKPQPAVEKSADTPVKVSDPAPSTKVDAVAPTTPVAIVAAQPAPRVESIVTPAVTPAPATPDLISSIATGLATLMSPFAANGQGAPSDSPMAWTVLSWARRQTASSVDADQAGPELTTSEPAAPLAFRSAAINAADTNHEPVAGPTIATLDPVTGVYSGTMNFTDPDGDPLTYYVLHQGVNGSVVYNQDGTFTYTPTQAARLRASLTPGPDMDGFALGASDGTADGNAYYHVPLVPGQLTLTTPLTGIGGPHQVAFSPDGARAYVPLYDDHKVLVLDTATNAVVGTVDMSPTLTSPVGAAVSPDGSRLYVTTASNGVAVVNTADNTVLTNIPVPAFSTFIAVSPDGTRGYVTSFFNNQVQVLDLTNNTAMSPITDVGSTPFDVTVGRDGTRAYVTTIAAGSSSIKVIDTATNTVVDTIDYRPQGSPTALKGLTLSADGTRLYTVASQEGKVLVINTADDSVVDTFSGFNAPSNTALSPDGSVLYVSSDATDSVQVIDAKTHELLHAFPIGDDAYSLGANPNGTGVYVIRANGRALTALTFVSLPLNQAPVAGASTYSAPNPATGAVSGALNFTDPDHDQLTYTVTSGPTRGTVVVNTDGTFVYTPTEAARLGANHTPGADLDSFTIAASDGTASTGVTLSPTIDVARLVLTTPDNAAGGPDITSFSPDGSRAYVAGVKDNTVKVYDTATNALIATIPVGVAPEGVTVNPSGTRAYAANTVGGMSVIDTSTNSVVGNIPLPDGSVRMTITPDGTRGYVSNYSQNTVAVVDLTNNTVITPIPGFNLPFDVAMGRDGSRAYVGNVGNGPGSVKVIDTASNTVVDTILDGPVTSGFEPYGFSLSPDGSRLYVADIGRSQVVVVDTATNTVVDHIGGLNNPTDIALSPDGSVLYAPNQGNSTVSVIDVATKSILATYAFGDYPYKLAANPNGTQVFISRTNADAVSVLTLVSGENHAPVAGLPTYGTADATTGAISGSLNFTDADGDPLTYTYSGDTTKGTFVVNSDGTFVYTPNQAARLGAYQTAGPDFASFAVTASDGMVTAAVNVVPAIAPGRLEMTTPFTGVSRPAAIAYSPDGSKAYITLDLDGKVLVVDTATNAVVGTVDLSSTGVSGPNGVAVSPDGNRVYVSNYYGGVSVINSTDNTVLQTIPLALGSVRVAVNPDGTRGYVTNNTPGVDTVTVLDLTNNTVVTTIPNINVPVDVAVSPDGTKAYAITTANGPASIKVIDTATNIVTDTIIFRPQGYPTGLIGLAFNADGSRLYTLEPSEGKVLALNTTDYSVVDSIGGFNVPTAVSLSPDGSIMYVSSQSDRTLIAVDAVTHAVLGTYDQGDNSGVIATNPNGLNTYVMPSNDGPISVLKFVSLPLNSAPVANGANSSQADAAAGAVQGSLNFTDPDGDPLTYSVATNPANGTVVINTDGTFIYTPDPVVRHAAAADGAPLSVTTDHFIVRAGDGQATTDEYVQVSVSPINHAPTPTGAVSTVPGLNNIGSNFVMSADGKRAYVETYDPDTNVRSLAMIDTATNTVTYAPLHGQVDLYTNIGAFIPDIVSPDGKHVYAVGGDDATGEHFIDVVDTVAGTSTKVAFPRTAQLYTSPDGGHVYGLSMDGLAILDTATNTVTTTALPYSPYKALTVRPDNAGVLVTNYDNANARSEIEVVDNDGTRTFYTLPGNSSVHVAPTVSPDGTHAYVVTTRRADGGTGVQEFLAVVDLISGGSTDQSFAGDQLTMSPDGAHLYTVIDHRTLGILDANGNPVDNIALGGATYYATKIAPDGQHLVVYGNPNGDAVYPDGSGPPVSSSSIALVDLNTNSVTTVPLASAANKLLFSPDGSYIFTGPAYNYQRGLTGSVSIIDTATGTVTLTHTISSSYPTDYTVSSDGRYASLLALHDDNSAYVVTIDTVTSQVIQTDIAGEIDWPTYGFTGDGAHFYEHTIIDNGDGTYALPVVSVSIPPSASATSGVTVGTPAAGTGVVTGGIHYTDPDHDALSYSVQTAPISGSITLDPATGAFTFTPNRSAGASMTSDTFTVIVDDGHGAHVPVTVTVPVAAANTAPTVTIRPVSGDYATGVVTYEATGIDPDGDPLTYAVTVDPTKGAVVHNADGTFTYTPTAAARHAASADDATYDDKWDTFTVTVTDPSGATGSAVATAMISPANEAPQPTRSSTESVIGDPKITEFTEFRDADGDPMTFTVTGGTKGVVTHIGNGNFTFMPTPEAQHAAASPSATPDDTYETVTVVANDGHGGTTTRVYTVPVKPQNTAPTVTLTQVGGTDGATGSKTYQVNGTDPDGDTLTYSVTANPTNGALVRNTDGTYTYTPTPAARHAAGADNATDAQKQDSFTITAVDGYGGTTATTATFNISVKNVAPTVTLAQVGGVNGTTGAATFRVTAADADGDPLTYSVATDPAKGTVVLNTNGTYTFTPTAAALHEAALTGATADQKQGTFIVVVNDAHGGNTAATATVTLPAKNVKPTVSLTQLSTDATTGSVTYRINGADADGDQLSYTVGTSPGKGSVTVNNDGTLTYTPTDAARHAASATGAPAATKRDTFTIVANDAHGGTATSATATVTISPRNAAPTVTLSQVGAIDPTTGATTYRPNAVDTDGDSVTYTITTRPTKGTLVANADGTYTYTPTATAAHAASADTATAAQLQDTFTITANDAHGATTPASATATITPRNSAPTVAITQVGGANATTGAVTYRVTGTDADRDTLTYTVTTDPTKGTLVRNTNGTYTYTPTAAARHDAAATGATADQKQDSFTITANDAHGSTVVTSVTATISPKNTAPTATPTVGTPDNAGRVTGTIGSADADGDTLSYAVATGPTKGSVTIDGNGGYVYTPSPTAQHAASSDTATAADKRDTFTVNITDDHGGTKAVTITVQVKPKNTGPGVAPTASSPTIATGGVAGTVGGSDGDNDALTYAVSTRPGKGTLVLNADGTYTYTPTSAARTTASKPNATAAQKQDTFAISVKDGHGGTTIVTYTVPLSLTTSGTVIITANPPSPL